MAQRLEYRYQTPSVSREDDKTPTPQDRAHDLLGIAPMDVILPISGRIQKKWSHSDLSDENCRVRCPTPIAGPEFFDEVPTPCDDGSGVPTGNNSPGSLTPRQRELDLRYYIASLEETLRRIQAMIPGLGNRALSFPQPQRVATPYPMAMVIDDEVSQSVTIHAPRPLAPNNLVERLNSWAADTNSISEPGPFVGHEYVEQPYFDPAHAGGGVSHMEITEDDAFMIFEDQGFH